MATGDPPFLGPFWGGSQFMTCNFFSDFDRSRPPLSCVRFWKLIYFLLGVPLTFFSLQCRLFSLVQGGKNTTARVPGRAWIGLWAHQKKYLCARDMPGLKEENFSFPMLQTRHFYHF